MLINSPYISGSQTTTGNAVISGSLTVLGAINGAVTGSTDSASFATTASYASNAELLDGFDSTHFTTTASFVSASASFDTRVLANSSSIGLLSSSFLDASSSFDTRILANSSSIGTLSSSFLSTSSSLNSRVGTIESHYATTGSNNFTNTQYISTTNNAISFTSTASFYTDGGVRVTKDMYVSGNAFFNNVTVFGTQSISYITSSQLNIGTNLITVNTDTPSIRFGGLAVYDSGSTGLSGSLLWDSEDNHWVYSNPSGSSYDGGMMISGPRNSSGLGNEQGVNACALIVGQGGDHVTSSAIMHYGNATCFYGNSFISSSGASCFNNSVTATSVITTGMSGTAVNIKGDESLNSNFGITWTTPTYTGGLAAIRVARRGATDASDMMFYTAPNGDVPNERLRITSTGVACFSSTVCAPSFLSSGTICSTGNTCFGGMSVVASCLGIGTSSPQSLLHICSTNNIILRVESACDQAGLRLIAGVPGTSRASRIDFLNGATCVGRPQWTIINDYNQNGTNDLSFINCDPLTKVLQIFQSGIACFACQVCAPAATIGGQISINAGNGNQLYLNNTGQRYTQITFDNNTSGATKGGLWWDNTTCFFEMYSSLNGGLRFYTGGDLAAAKVTLTSTGIACFACQVCSPMFLSTGCIGILQYSPETSLDIGNLANQAAWSSTTSCDANLGENFENNIIIQAQHAAVANNAYGYPASNLVFRASNAGNAIWNIGAIQGVVDPFGGAGYQGGLVFLTKPSACNCDPGGRKTQCGPLVPVLTLGQNASNSRIAFFNSSVGIGTASPTCKLEVDGGSSAVGLRISTTNTGTGVASLILANSSKSAFNDGMIMTHGGGYTNITGLTGATIMAWDMSSCRVGIGTVTPGQRLAVSGNSYFGCLATTLNFSQGGNDRFLEIGSGEGGDALLVTHASGYGVGYFGYETSNDRLVIATDCGSGANKIDFILNAGTATGGTTDNLTANPVMRITAGGKVGIMTTDPKADFHVCGSIATLRVGPWFSTNDRDFIQLEAQGVETRILSPNERFKIENTDGCVQIVAGGSGGVQLTPGATSWASMSDRRKKKNFESTQGLAALLQIEPVKYHFQWDNDCIPKRMGFIAQNIQPLIPEMVSKTDEKAEDGSNYLTITPDYILPVLVKSIQEQQCTICTQALRINILESCLGLT